MTSVVVAVLGVCLIVVAAWSVSTVLGLAVLGGFLLAAGLLVEFEDDK